jgi:hypothetical protein
MTPTRFALTLALFAAGTAPAAADLLSGRQIDETIRGRRIYLAVPLGGEFPLNYRADGKVDGSGEAVGLGRTMRPTDSGRWWVDGTKLCQQWTSWYGGKVFCFTLRKTAPTQLAWTRDDGLSGIARIGR